QAQLLAAIGYSKKASCTVFRKFAVSIMCSLYPGQDDRQRLADFMKHSVRVQKEVYEVSDQTNNAAKVHDLMANVLNNSIQEEPGEGIEIQEMPEDEPEGLILEDDVDQPPTSIHDDDEESEEDSLFIPPAPDSPNHDSPQPRKRQPERLSVFTPPAPSPPNPDSSSRQRKPKSFSDVIHQNQLDNLDFIAKLKLPNPPTHEPRSLRKRKKKIPKYEEDSEWEKSEEEEVEEEEEEREQENFPNKKRKSAKAFRCDECHKTWESAWLLKRHKAVHQDNALFTCQRCMAQYKHLDSLKRHKKTAKH
ncbi:unnamed protein product, partial [Owenia fusiformis]